MGMDLVGEKGGSFSVNWNGWESLLALAETYEWKPMGAFLPEKTIFDEVIDFDNLTRGNYTYYSNDGQVVVKEDAMAIAKALTKACRFSKSLDRRYREWIFKFICFCRRGGFLIY